MRDLKYSKIARNVEESLFYDIRSSMTKFGRCTDKGTSQSVRKPSPKINGPVLEGHPELGQNISGRLAWKGTLGTEVAFSLAGGWAQDSSMVIPREAGSKPGWALGSTGGKWVNRSLKFLTVPVCWRWLLSALVYLNTCLFHSFLKYISLGIQFYVYRFLFLSGIDSSFELPEDTNPD